MFKHHYRDGCQLYRCDAVYTHISDARNSTLFPWPIGALNSRQMAFHTWLPWSRSFLCSFTHMHGREGSVWVRLQLISTSEVTGIKHQPLQATHTSLLCVGA